MKTNYSDDDVCVIAAGCVLPDAENPSKYWDNIISGKCSVRELPEHKLSKKLYLSKENKEDKTISNYAAFVSDETLKKICEKNKINYSEYNKLHILALEAAKQAIREVNKNSFLAKKASIILGCGWPDERLPDYQMTEEENSLKKHIKKHVNKNPDAAIHLLNDYFKRFKKKLKLPVQHTLTNSVCENIKEKYGIEADGCLIDAACASSLAAIEVSMKKLKSYESDIVITGGIDNFLEPENFVIFSKSGTLSPDRCYPFDKKTKGLVQGEGAVIFVLQRVEDAIKYKNKILGILRSCGCSSDGKYSSLFSPSKPGQIRALKKAYGSLEDKKVDFIECHGTGTEIGDVTELEALNEFFLNSKKKIPIGSVKSIIGHTKGTAGAAGLLKSILAVNNRIIPPSPYFNSMIYNNKNKVFVNKKPIKLNPRKDPIKFGISSFGFGGINYHLILEEFKGNFDVAKKNDKKADEKIVVVAQSYVSAKKSEKYIKKHSFNITPKSLPSIDKLQIQAIAAVHEAINKHHIRFDSMEKDRISVISSTCLCSEQMSVLSKRVKHFEIADNFSPLGNKIKKIVLKHKEKFPKITEDAGPGTLNNVIAGRVCNAFNFLGKSFNVDADFNSFVIALQSGITELQSGDSEVVILLGTEEELNKSKTHLKRGGLRCLVLTKLRIAIKQNFEIISEVKVS